MISVLCGRLGKFQIYFLLLKSLQSMFVQSGRIADVHLQQIENGSYPTRHT